MACKFSELIIDANDPDAAAAFWAQVLDYRETGRDEDWVELAGPEGSGPTLVFLRVPESKTVKNRVHIDVSPTDRDQQEEVERIIALGASPADVGQGDDVPWVVLRDPEGNEFCVLRTRRDPWGGS